MYHHVDPSTPPSTSIDPARFEAHIEYLVAEGFDIWPLPRLMEHVRAGKPTSNRTVAITFDDAYISIYTRAFPILRKHGLPFTIFVATEYVNTSPGQYLSWDQLNEMKRAGATIANHTHSHTHLLRRQAGEGERTWQDRVRSEIVTAQVNLLRHTGEDHKLIAYPYGEYNDAIVAIVEDLGYTGFGQQSGAIGPNSMFSALPRFPMGGPYSGMESFMTKVDTLPMPIETVYQDPTDGDRTEPLLKLSFEGSELRLDQLVCYGPDGERMPVTQVSPLSFETSARVPSGRSRYNCTMPTGNSDRFYWFSQMWIRKLADGSWYPEP